MKKAVSTHKVQKLLAQIGIASRREIEQWVREGRIRINKRTATIGDRITGKEKIYLDNTLVKLDTEKSEPTRILLYNKPLGEICTRKDPKHRPTVFDKLPPLKNGRWIAVGRLDINTSGLLLFTNDGELAHRLMHPSSQLERGYAVRIFGTVTEEMLKRLQRGIHLDGELNKFENISYQGGEGLNQWYHVTLKEGRYREVRRLWESQGLKVSRLIRIRFGDIRLPKDLRGGKYRELSTSGIEKLLT